MNRVSDLNGTFVGASRAPRKTALWNSLTAHQGSVPGSEIRLTVLNESTLRIERLVDGLAVEQRDVHFRFVAGYARITYPICHASVPEAVLVTSIGCGEIALTVTPGERALAVYSDAHVFGTMDLIPVPVDVVPEWSLFRRADQAP